MFSDLTNFLKSLKPGKKPRGLLFIVAVVIILILIVSIAWKNFRVQTPNATTTTNSLTTHGDNSPIISGSQNKVTINDSSDSPNRSVIVSGTSNTVTVNKGISNEQLDAILDRTAKTSHERLKRKFPGGYVLFTKNDALLIYQEHLRDIAIAVDWKATDIFLKNGSVVVNIGSYSMKRDNPPFSLKITDTQMVNFVRLDTPSSLIGFPPWSLNLEVIDLTNSVFALGFAPQ